MFVCFIENKNNILSASNQQTTSSKVLTMQNQQGIGRKKTYKKNEKTSTNISRGTSF